MNTFKLQVPIDKTLRDKAAKRADELGFDSTQALVRYVLKAVIDRRQVTFGEDNWGEPSPEAAARINLWAEEARRDSIAGKLKSYANVEEFMEDLHK